MKTRGISIINYFSYLLLFTLTIISSNLYGQSDNPTALINLSNSTKQRLKTRLFIHYDKNIYVPNETIWFTAYLLTHQDQPNQPSMISLAIINHVDRSIASKKKFAFTALTASGSLMIPDSIPQGEYSIIAYSDLLVNGSPDPLFTQQISIRQPGPPTSIQVTKSVKGNAQTINEQVKVDFKFYPEGGDLVAGIPAYVGWEAKDKVSGAPIALTAVLLKDQKIIDTIRTSEFGMGKFPLNAIFGSHYEVRPIGSKYTGTAALPIALEKGVSLAILAAAAEDSLRVKISNSLPSKLHVVVHNQQAVFLALPDIQISTSRVFRIPLTGVPKGLTLITIFNEHLQPVAERIFYAHYSSASPVSIATDSLKYGKKQKVKIKLDLHSEIDTSALLSMAVVKGNRISGPNFTDIENYQFLEQNLAFYRLPIATAERRKYAEDVLLIKGWRRYIDTSSKVITPISNMTGLVMIKKKTVKKPTRLTLMSPSSLFFVETDSAGNFDLTNPELLIEDGRSLRLFATGDDANETKISIADPIDEINQSLSKKLAIVDTAPISIGQIEPLMPINESTLSLKTVTIKGRSDNDYYGIKRAPWVNACGDYICPFGWLNCPKPGHNFNTTAPIKGKKYPKLASATAKMGTEVVYAGCDMTNKSIINVNAINKAKEFYSYGETEVKSGEPLYLSTLYWAPSINLKQGMQQEFSFYTGEIKGIFNIVVQGITKNGVVFSEKKIEVDDR